MNRKKLYEKVIKKAGHGISLSDIPKDRFIQKCLIESAYKIGFHAGVRSKKKIDKLLNELDQDQNNEKNIKLD